MLTNAILVVAGQRWKINSAVTLAEAKEAINAARSRGTVRYQALVDRTACGGTVEVLADVVALTAEGTERQPYCPY